LVKKDYRLRLRHLKNKREVHPQKFNARSVLDRNVLDWENVQWFIFCFNFQKQMERIYAFISVLRLHIATILLSSLTNYSLQKWLVIF